LTGFHDIALLDINPGQVHQNTCDPLTVVDTNDVPVDFEPLGFASH
jgi:hypothetical protein